MAADALAGHPHLASTRPQFSLSFHSDASTAPSTTPKNTILEYVKDENVTHQSTPIAPYVATGKKGQPCSSAFKGEDVG